MLGVDNVPVAGAVVETHPGAVQMAVTADNGEFTFALHARGAVVHARKNGLQSAPALASASTPERSLILTLKEAGQLRVRVVSASNQRPVAGATLKLLRAGDTASKEQELRSDEQGTASFTLGMGGNLQVLASADGFGAVQRRFWAAPASTGEQQLTLALPPECSARGVVKNRRGQPAAHARVTARDVSSNQSSVSVEADEQGRFRFAQLHAAVFTFQAFAQKLGWGESPLVELPSTRDIAITVDSKPALQGVVLDAAGRAVPAALVQALPQAGGAYRLPERRQQLTDAQGQFEFLGLPTTRVLVGATLGGAASDTVDIDLTQQARVELRLTASDGISGKVVDPAGHPVPGARVTARLQGMPAAQSLAASAGPDGSFALSAVGTGQWELFAQSPTNLVGGEDELERVLATVEAGATGVSLVVPDAGAIEGWIELEDGSIPDTAALVLSGRSLVSPSGGSFFFQGIPEGTHELVVTGPGFEATRVPSVVVRANETTSLDAIRVHAGRRLRGRVTNASQRPVAGVEIMVSTSLYAAAQGLNRSSLENQPDLRYAWSDDSGAFEVRGIGQARVGVLAEHPTYGRSGIAIVEANASAELELVLQSTADVRGTVTKGGRPLEGIAVIAKDEASIATFTGISGREGTYQLVRLPVGKYVVTAVNRQSGGNFDMRKRDVTLLPSKGQTLDFDFGAGGAVVNVYVPDAPGEPQSAFLKGRSVYVQQARTNGAYVFEDVLPGEYELCITFAAEGAESVLPRCQSLSVAAGGKAQEVRL
ncbi:MAG TPA: carboxypeptidase-like regulatory domain-containing protein [Polyangiaceae bacterium]|nr:carboxypeptidase-like regulatory domain-containing protein [Polyangiaceae bacterium]